MGPPGRYVVTPRLRWASGILVGLGLAHLALSTLADRAVVAGSLRDGVWATVPLAPAGESKRWRPPRPSGPAGAAFSVPLILLGVLVRHLARQGSEVPSWLGWGIASWTLVGGLLLPSQFFLGVVPGLLLVLEAHREVPQHAPRRTDRPASSSVGCAP